MEKKEQDTWFVATIRNGQDKKIGRRLAELKVDHYVPSVFKTLLFFRTVRSRALTLVNSGEIPAKFIIDHKTHTLLEVPEKQMTDFMRVLDLSPDAECLTTIPFAKGGRVRVIKGPLNGVEGEIEEVGEGLYLLVSVCSLMCAKIEIPKSYVVAI